MHTILRLPDVKRSTGLSRSTIYLRISQGTFPKPVSLGGRAVGWLEAEIQEWLQRRIEASRRESSDVGATLGARSNFQTDNLKT
jgi:prophage regulatory protein